MKTKVEGVKRTLALTYNIRLSTIPECNEEQYTALLNDETVEVSDKTKKYLIYNGYAVGVE